MQKEISFYTQNQLGIIVLSRPHALNAINLTMCQALYDTLIAWEKDDAIKAVVIRGEGDRSFCAGGDIKQIYENRTEKKEQSELFFWHEYRLNHRIAHYKKPYIALCHGITMGGGVGISIYGSHRVAAPTLQWAMPETGIGFFPDVGASYFLNKLPGAIGKFLGLTGHVVHAEEALLSKIMDYIVPYDAFDVIIENLSETDLTSHINEKINAVLKKYALTAAGAHLSQGSFLNEDNLNILNNCFSNNALVKIIQSLSVFNTPWCEKIVRLLLKKSPTSLFITFEALQREEAKKCDSALMLDYRIACHMLNGHDFYEGVRAMLVDKDQAPSWKPDVLENITEPVISTYFEPLSQELTFD